MGSITFTRFSKGSVTQIRLRTPVLGANVQRLVQTLKLKYLQEGRFRFRFWNGHHNPRNIIENVWRDLKHAIHTKRPKNISELKVFWKNGEKWKSWLLGSVYKLFYYIFPKRSYKVLTGRVPKRLHRAFFLFFIILLYVLIVECFWPGVPTFLHTAVVIRSCTSLACLPEFVWCFLHYPVKWSTCQCPTRLMREQ